jgi:hypothetical protein
VRAFVIVAATTIAVFALQGQSLEDKARTKFESDRARAASRRRGLLRKLH